MINTKQITIVSAIMLNLCLVVPSALAADRTWDGAGGDNNWSTATNWVGGVAPVNNDNLFFSGTTRQNNTNDLSNLTVGTVNFNTGGFTLNGNTLTLNPGTTGMVTNTTGINTLALPFIITPAGKWWSIAAGSELRLAGVLTNTSPTGTATGWLFLTNGGTVRITGNAHSARCMDLYQGTIIVDGGTVNADNDGWRIRPPTGQTVDVQITNNGYVRIGGGGNFRMGNGTAGAGSLTTAELSSGTLAMDPNLPGAANGGNLFVGEAAGAKSIFTQNGGLITQLSVGSGTPFNTLTIGNGANADGTYNLNGGVLCVGRVQQGNAGATNVVFNFNGGTLTPYADSSSLGTFFQGLLTANVQGGGAIIDTTNLNITIGQNLQAGTPSGGLTKLGTGTLTLSGNDTYTGATIVSNGTLIVNSDSLIGHGSVVVAGGATLNVTNNGSTWTTPSLTVGSAGASALQFNFPYGNAGSATIVATNLTASGSVTINVTGSGMSVWSFPLIQFTTASGLSSFHLGAVPNGTQASLVQTANSINLNITLVGESVAWTGAANNSQWDTNSINWADMNSSSPVKYTDGDFVTFDDNHNSSGLSAINVGTTVSPAVIAFNSFAYNYSFTGSGKISGSAVMSMNAFANVDMGTTNDFSGGTTVNEGALQVGQDQALGTGPVTIILGSLSSDSAAPHTLANSIIYGADLGVVLGDSVNNGVLTLAGTLDLGGSSTRTLDAESDIVIAGTMTDGGFASKIGPGNLIVKGTATLNALVNQQQGDVVVDGGTLTSGNGWRIQSSVSTATHLVITNGGHFYMTANSANILVGLTGGQSGLDNILDIAGNVSTAPLVPATSNGQVNMGQSGANDILNLRSGGLLICRAIAALSATPPANTVANFYGGTLMPLADNTAFMQGLTSAYIYGGLTVDTTNFNITIAQNLQAGGAGGLTKLGSGTLTLSGTNTYTGLTAINAGKLVLQPGAASGGIAVANNATLAFLSSSPGVTVRVSSVTNANGSALEAQFTGLTANPATPAGFITNLVLNGTVSVNLFSSHIEPGTIPLIGYGTITGSGNLTVGILPQGTVGSLTTNAGMISLVVSSVTPTKWTGAINGNWDTTTTNWTSGGVPVAYAQYANASFDDTASNPIVNLTASETPSSTVVSNNTLSYQFTGSGSLAGSGGLTKFGANTLTINTANSFSGDVAINAGTIIAGSGTALGGGSGTVHVNNGGALDINGLQIGGESQVIVLGGSGVNGGGALINSGGSQNDATYSVVLTNDTTICCSNITGIRATADNQLGLVGNGYKLTKIGLGQLNLNGGTTTAGLTNVWFTDIGNIDIKQGAISFERRAALGRTNNTIAVEPGATLELFSLNQSLPVPGNSIVMTNGILQGTGGAADTNTLGSQITLNGLTNLIDVVQWVGTTQQTLLYLNGPIVGSGGVYFSGASPTNSGMIRLAGTNTYTGATIITNGTLTLAATGKLTGTTNIYIDATGILDVSAAAPWTLGANQTLSGFGAVNGNVVANGTVSPGASIGTLMFNNNLTLAGTTLMEVTRDGGLNNDMVAVNGTLAYGGTLKVVLTGSTPLQTNDTFHLFSFTSAPTGTFTATNLPAGYTWDTSQLSSAGTIKVTGVTAVATNTPYIRTVSISGGNLTMTGTNGNSGVTYYVLTSTNLALALTNWSPVLTNTFAPNGNFTNTLPVVPGEPKRFYLLEVQ